MWVWDVVRVAIGVAAGVHALAFVWVTVRVIRERHWFFDSQNRFVNRFAWYRYWQY